jgi:ABC-2 type transport system permease protein
LRRILLIIKNDVKRRLKSPGTILVMLLIPLIMTGIIGAIFSPKANSTGLPKIKVLLVDKDKSFGAQFLTGVFDSREMKEMFQTTRVNEAEGNKLMSKGKASAMVVIPEKFTEQLMDGKTSELTVIKNPSQRFLPTVVEEAMATTAVIISGAAQVFGDEIKNIKSMMEKPIEDVSMMALMPYMEKARKKLIGLKTYLNPLLLELKSEVAENKKEKQDVGFDKSSNINAFSVMLPGMAIMFLLFIVEMLLRDILTEREDGKLQRIMFAPIRPMELITARIFSGFIMGIFIYFIIAMAGTVLFDIAWGNYGYLFILTAVTCFWISSFFALLNAFFKNKNQAGAFISPIILVFSAFGGSMIPIEQLPKAMQWISQFTLNYWFITGSREITGGGFPLESIGIILLTGIVLFVLATLSLNKRITV